MGLNTDACLCGPVTVWHFLWESPEGDAVYHASVYDAALWERVQADEEHPSRRAVHRMGGFLFPPPGGDGEAPVTPTPVRDCIARGDCSAHETPAGAREAGYDVCHIDEVIRPPRLSGGSMVDWVQFTASRTHV